MTYDNRKLHAAMQGWIEQRCRLAFGESYSGELQDDFEDFCNETGLMKRSPGRVVFGRELARLGFEKRKKVGLTFWAGIQLKNPPTNSRPRYHKATIAIMEAQQAEHNPLVKEQMEAETKTEKRIRWGDFP